MGARFINNDGTPIRKLVGVKKQYENINGVFEPVYYDGYVLFNGLTTDGIAYIDLGRKGYGNNTHVIDFTLTTLSGNVGIYGDRTGYTKMIGIIYYKPDNTIFVDNGENDATNRFMKASATIGRYKTTISATKTTMLHDGVFVAEINYTTPICSETNSSLKVFRYPKWETPITYFQGISTVHSIKEYSSSGVLLYHYVPARRNSDNKLGLLDVVNGVFYTNAAGSGSFSV